MARERAQGLPCALFFYESAPLPVQPETKTEEVTVNDSGSAQWSTPVRSAAVACLVLAALAPLVSVSGMMYPSVVPKALLVRSAVGVGTALLIWGVATGRYRSSDVGDPILWSLIAVSAVFLLSGLAGPSPHHSFFGDFERSWGAVQWICLTLLYVLLRTFLGDRGWRLLLRVSLFVAVGVAVFGVFEFAIEEAYPHFNAQGTSSTLGITGYLGAYTILGAGLALVVVDRAVSGAWRPVVAGAAVLLFGTVLMLSGGRAALLGAALGGGAGLTIYWLRRTDRPGTVAAWIGASAVFAAVALGGAWLLVPDVLMEVPVISRIARLDQSIGSLVGRVGAWEAGLEGLLARPLTGWGPENFDLLYARFVDPVMHRLNPEGMRFDRAHNVLVGKLAMAGPAGVAAYLALWGSIFVTGLRAWKMDRLGALEGSALLAALAGYFVYLQFWFEDHSTAVVLVTLVAYLRHRRSGSPLFRVERPQSRSAVRSAAWGTACLGIAALALWMNGRTALAAARMGDAHAAENLAAKVRHYEGARRLGIPEQRSVALEYASEMADLGLRSGPRLRDSDALRRRFSRAVEGADRALSAASEKRPPDPWIDAQRGRLAAGAAVVFAGDEIQTLAVESLRRAVGKSPALLENRHTLASIRALLGDPGGGRETLREALELYDGYGRTYYLLSQMSGPVADSAALNRLRQSFWLDYYPEDEDREYLRRTAEALLERGEAGRAERLFTSYVASRYLPELRERGDPFAAERERFLRGLDAEVAPAGREGRPYTITRGDLPFLAVWIRAATAAGRCSRAVIAARVLLDGLGESKWSASLRPVLAGQLDRLRARCGDRSPP